jgi:putative flippase GtrA
MFMLRTSTLFYTSDNWYTGVMEHDEHHAHHGQADSLNKTAASATLHCLTGCSIGEVLGMILSTIFSLGAALSVAISIVLAFMFGYALSMRPLVPKLGLRRSAKVALGSDTASIATMELADNAFILVVPGAISAGLNTGLFWISLAVSLAVAFMVAFPVNRYLIKRGKGHALVHEYHH